MKRNAIKYLYQWKASNDRKPLIMLGARQVGKTWLMQEFAKEAYTRSAYVNFEDNEMLREVFAHDFDIPRIINSIQWSTGVSIGAARSGFLHRRCPHGCNGVQEFLLMKIRLLSLMRYKKHPGVSPH